MRRITKAITVLEVGTGGNKLPEIEAVHPVQEVTQQLHGDIVPRLADLLYLLGMRQCQPQFGPDQVNAD